MFNIRVIALTDVQANSNVEETVDSLGRNVCVDIWSTKLLCFEVEQYLFIRHVDGANLIVRVDISLLV